MARQASMVNTTVSTRGARRTVLASGEKPGSRRGRWRQGVAEQPGRQEHCRSAWHPPVEDSRWGEVGGHRTIAHDGIWKGFLSDMVFAPDDGSVSSRSPTPERSTPAARRCPSPTPCSTSRKMPCAPTSRNVPRSGVTYAAGIPSAPVCSWTPSKGPCSGPAWRSSSAATTSPSAARRRCPRCARVFGSTRTATTLTPSASMSPGSGRAPLQWCSAADPAARWPPCTSASCRCPSRNGPTFKTPDRGSTAPSPHHHGGRYPPASHHQGTTECGRITAAVPCERLLGGQLATMISLRGVSLFVKVIGRGYPLLLMHGGPGQTSGQVPGGLVRLAATKTHLASGRIAADIR